MLDTLNLELAKAEFDPDDPSLEILLDSETMTIVSIDNFSGESLLIADINPGARLLRDVERFLYSYAEFNGARSSTTSQTLPGGVLRLITRQQKDE